MSDKPASPAELRPDHPTCVARIRRATMLTCLLAIGTNVVFVMPVWAKALVFAAGVLAGVLAGVSAHLNHHRRRDTPGAREAYLTFETAVFFFGGGTGLVCWLIPQTSDHAGYLGIAAALLSGTNALVWWYAHRYPRLHWHLRPAIDADGVRFEPLDLAGAPFALDVPAGSQASLSADGATLAPPPGAHWGELRIAYRPTDTLHPATPARPAVVKARPTVAGVPALLTSHRLAERGTLALRFVLVPWLVEIELDETPAADPAALLRRIGESVRQRPEDADELARVLLAIGD